MSSCALMGNAMNSEKFAEIQSRFKRLRNEIAGIVEVETRIRRLRELNDEELSLINTPTVWEKISKLCGAKLSERSYVSKGEFGPAHKITQYMVTDTDLSFFDNSGFVVFTRLLFDLTDAEFDELVRSKTDKRDKMTKAALSSTALKGVADPAKADTISAAREPSELSAKTSP